MTDPTPTTTNPTVTLDAATVLVAEGRAAADAQGCVFAVAVTDGGGHLVAFERTDGAPFLTATVAVDKAWTAASFRLSTHVWSTLLQDPAIAALGGHSRMLAVGGGYPLVVDGRTVGGLGVSGGSAQQDLDGAARAIGGAGFEVPAG